MNSSLRVLLAAGAVALSAGIAGTATAGVGSLKAPGVTADTANAVVPVIAKNCYPIYAYRRVHISSSSLLVIRRVLIGVKCFPLAIKRPRLPIPDPGPLKKRIGGLKRVNPQFVNPGLRRHNVR